MNPTPLLQQLLQDLPLTAASIIGVDFLRYFLSAGIVYWLVWRVFGRALAGRKISDVPPKPGQKWREFKNSMRTVVIFGSTGTLIFITASLGDTQIYENVADYGIAWWWASLLLISVLHDTWFYWTHRLLHRPWWFAKFHTVHHQSVHPTPWSAYSFHPVEAVIQVMFFAIVVHAIPMHPLVLFIFVTWMNVRNAVGHSAYELMPWCACTTGPLRWLLTNSHHHFHHAAGKGNFALYFTWWDRWMGTEDVCYIANGDERFIEGSHNHTKTSTGKEVA